MGEEREIISSLSPFSFCSSRLNESHKGDNSSGYLSATFAFAHGTSPDLSLSPFEKGGEKRGIQRLEKGVITCHPPPLQMVGHL